MGKFFIVIEDITVSRIYGILSKGELEAKDLKGVELWDRDTLLTLCVGHSSISP